MTVVPSGEQFEIVAGDHRATLVEVGGGLRGYTCGGRVVLDGYPADQMCTGGRRMTSAPFLETSRRARHRCRTGDGAAYRPSRSRMRACMSSNEPAVGFSPLRMICSALASNRK